MEQLIKKIEAFISENTLAENPPNLYQPVNYSMKTGAKRIRPVLCMLAAQLFGHNSDAALYPALALEMFHNFTLVHDDIMDKSEIRRGRPTVQAKYGVNTAILSGDVMLIKSYEYLSKVEPSYLPVVLDLFNQTATKVCEGQQLDMDFETREEISLDEYITMISGKTAALLAGALAIGAKIGGAYPEQIRAIYEFGLNIGIAFQIQDDLLDAFGNEKQIGKQIGSDILNNKKTYLLITALNIADLDTRQELNKWLSVAYDSRDTEKINAVKDIFTRLNIPTITQNAIDHYYQLGLLHFHTIGMSANQMQPLLFLTDMLINRKK